jgi:hypothetical protein
MNHQLCILHVMEFKMNSLILTDGGLKVLDIMCRPEGNDSLDIKKSMPLAFLSACETAKGDRVVPDEAMHLAATLLFAGFRGVVATMWQVVFPPLNFCIETNPHIRTLQDPPFVHYGL